MGTPISQRKKR